MANVVIPWTTGTGDITLTFEGQGNGTITVTSSPNDLNVERSQVVTVKTLDESVEVSLTIRQAAKAANFITSDGNVIVTSDGDVFNAKDG